MRRKPKENNLRAVLATVCELENTECVVPEWLHDVILGYGGPGAAHYSRSVVCSCKCSLLFHVLFMYC